VQASCLVLVFAGCTATSADGAGSPRKQRFDFSIVYTDETLGELEVDFDPPTFTFADVDRERVGVRFAFGNPGIAGFVTPFSETWGSGVDFDAFGVAGGIVGAPRVGNKDSAVGLLIPYLVQFGIGYGDENSVSLLYLDTRLEVGFGIDWKGIQPSVGLISSSIVGGLDDSILDESALLTGFNLGGYAELKYKHPELGLYGRLRALFGDVEGVEASLGFAW
jgi:hypothetical protein